MIDDATLTPAEPVPPPPPEGYEIFFSKDGLRAGWSLLIFITLCAALFFCAIAVGRAIHPRAPKGIKTSSDIPLALTLFIVESIPFLIVLLATWIMSKIERRPNSVYGLGGTRSLLRFLTGMAWGVTCLSLLVFTLWRTGFLIIESRLLFGSEILRYGAMWLLFFLLVGLLEEYLTRGYLQFTLTRGLAGLYQWGLKTPRSGALGFWTSALILSTLFGLTHGKNPGETPIGLAAAGLVSMVFCLSLWRTGSLWWAIGFHAGWDWAQSFLYGVADSGTMVQHHLLATHPVGNPVFSGGATGPEGSIFILAILVLASLIIIFTLPRAHYGLPGGDEPA